LQYDWALEGLLAKDQTSRVRTIAISRQRGAGGAYIGRTVAERLGFLYVDREMLRVAAEYLADRESELAAPASPLWTSFVMSFAHVTPEYYVPPPLEAVYENDILTIQNRLVKELVSQHTTVIVGRGIAQTLHGHEGVLSVFLHAPEPWRVERVQQIYGTDDERGAGRLVQDSDRERARFVQRSCGASWTDARGYDLAIDVGRFGLDHAVGLIMAAADACNGATGTTA